MNTSPVLPTSCVVRVSRKGDAYHARTGCGPTAQTASSTSSAETAAERAGAKFLECAEELVGARLLGEQPDGEQHFEVAFKVDAWAQLALQIDTLVGEVFTLNQEVHCYNHKRVVEQLLVDQTRVLKRLMKLTKAVVSSPKLAPVPAVASGMGRNTVDWRDPAQDKPDALVNVLVALEDGEVDAAYYNGDGTWSWLAGDDINVPVMAWCDMPEAPATETVQDDIEAAGGAS